MSGPLSRGWPRAAGLRSCEKRRKRERAVVGGQWLTAGDRWVALSTPTRLGQGRCSWVGWWEGQIGGLEGKGYR